MTSYSRTRRNKPRRAAVCQLTSALAAFTCRRAGYTERRRATYEPVVDLADVVPASFEDRCGDCRCAKGQSQNRHNSYAELHFQYLSDGASERVEQWPLRVILCVGDEAEIDAEGGRCYGDVMKVSTRPSGGIYQPARSCTSSYNSALDWISQATSCRRCIGRRSRVFSADGQLCQPKSVPRIDTTCSRDICKRSSDAASELIRKYLSLTRLKQNIWRS